MLFLKKYYLEKIINISRFYFFTFLDLEIFLDIISLETISRNNMNLTKQKLKNIIIKYNLIKIIKNETI